MLILLNIKRNLLKSLAFFALGVLTITYNFGAK